jgi:ABC-type transport system involved in cytochrome bd biosynthesis fused ATPase/permease subunit
MIGHQLSRIIIDIPWLHNTIGFLFLMLLLSIILLVPYILYRITRHTGEKRKEWSFEGKNWEYWRTHR